MKKRMKLFPFLSHSKTLHTKITTTCPFPSYCTTNNINTLSFRATNTTTNNNNISQHYTFTTFNSTYLNLSYLDSFSTMSNDNNLDNFTIDDPIESIIRGLRSERLFFEPEKSSSLVVQQEKQEAEQELDPDKNGLLVYKESEALCMDSNNPCEDFRRSMEEMVEAHGLKNDWLGLEELLGCYLKINDKSNHGYIMGAFIDLLVNISFINNNNNNSNDNSTTTSSSLLSTNLNCSSPSSPLSLPSSNLTTPCLSSLLDHDDDDDQEDQDNVSDDHGGEARI